MAVKKGKGTNRSIIVELGTPQPKKHVTRYDSVEESDDVNSIYVAKSAIEAIGSPDKIRVTIEAA
jgi:hypothetical protein